MKINDAVMMSILFDYYGKLLTEKQSQIFTLYHDDNLSLSEIGEKLNVSKQGVHDALKKAESALEDFESKLGLIRNSRQNEDLVDEAMSIIAKLNTDKNVDSKIKKEIKKVEKNIDRLSL